MEPMVFEHGEVYLHVENGILELFRRNRIIGSYRTPVKWARVRFDHRKKGLSRLHFGNVEHLDDPLYASARGRLLAMVEIAPTDEPQYRAFFTELARRTNRRIAD
ncbi:hypothetical protein ACI2LF_19255 [Kribbella sp. NPDC020789]